MRGNIIKYTALRKEYSDEIFVDTIAEFERTALPAILQEDYSLHSAFQVLKFTDRDTYRIMSRLWSWDEGKEFLRRTFSDRGYFSEKAFLEQKEIVAKIEDRVKRQLGDDYREKRDEKFLKAADLFDKTALPWILETGLTLFEAIEQERDSKSEQEQIISELWVTDQGNEFLLMTFSKKMRFSKEEYEIQKEKLAALRQDLQQRLDEKK